MKEAIFLCVLLALVGPSFGQVFSFGRCPDVTTKPDFNISLYMGEWFEYERFFFLFEIGAKCAKAEYTLLDNGHVRVVNSAKDRSPAVGDAYVPDPAEPAKLKVKFSSWQPEGDYWVLQTDFWDYAVVYACQNYLFIHSETCWILTRARSGISDQKKQQIYSVLSNSGINVNNFKKTDQTDC